MERGVKAREVAAFDAGSQRREVALQAWIRREERLGGQSVRCQEVARDEVGED